MVDRWVIDAGLSHDQIFCFVPLEQDEEGKPVFVTGMSVFASDVPSGLLVGVIHPEGQQAADEWYEAHKDQVDTLLKTRESDSNNG